MQAKIAAADARLSDMTFYADNPDAYQGSGGTDQTRQGPARPNGRGLAVFRAVERRAQQRMN